MRTVLITGGTVFISRYVASHFVAKGDRVYVLNRGTKPQVEGVTPLLADRHALGSLLQPLTFDAVLDLTAFRPVTFRFCWTPWAALGSMCCSVPAPSIRRLRSGLLPRKPRPVQTASGAVTGWEKSPLSRHCTGAFLRRIFCARPICTDP